MSETMTGGCQCGRVRYRVEIHNDDAYLCHCRMCQRATGGVFIAFKNVKKADVIWEREPESYASSPIANRGFCSACGTPLTFAFPDSANMDLTVGPPQPAGAMDSIRSRLRRESPPTAA